MNLGFSFVKSFKNMKINFVGFKKLLFQFKHHTFDVMRVLREFFGVI